jgi:hypothetical protein
MVFSVGRPCWLAEKGTRPPGSLQVINLRPKNSNVLAESEVKSRLHIVVCTTEQLGEIVCTDHDAALVVVGDPPAAGQTADDSIPEHGLSRLLGSLKLHFAALEPANHEQTWHEPVEPYGRPVTDLVMSHQDGKRLWYFLRRRDPAPEVLVVAADDGQVALSLGYAICDTFRLNKAETMYLFVAYDEDDKHDREPPIKHVYDRVRECRAMVC